MKEGKRKEEGRDKEIKQPHEMNTFNPYYMRATHKTHKTGDRVFDHSRKPADDY